MTPLFAKQSSDRSFERLYRAYVQDVFRYTLMVLRNRADAEDVTQTTFLKAYRAFRRGERPRHPRPWLITIAHNTCRTRLRDATRRPQEVALDTELLNAAAPEPTETVEPRELVRALGALSFNQRAALVMRELEGRTYAEIGDLLSISSSAVETLLFRARRALREQLEGALDCGEAERALSLQLDGRLDRKQQGVLRAHLRECAECASLARRQRARRAALRSLGPFSLPASLASWGGAGAGVGLGAKAAALIAAGVAVAGAGGVAADAERVGAPEPRAHIVADATASRTQPVAVVRRAAREVAAPAPRAVRPQPAPKPTPEPKPAANPEPTSAAPGATPAPSEAEPAAAPAAAPAPKEPSTTVAVTAPVEVPASVPVPVQTEIKVTVTVPVEVPTPALPALPELPPAPEVPVLP